MKRGEVAWADAPEPEGSAPGYRRPYLILQSDQFNQSRIRTVVVAALTTNLLLASAPGNVIVTAQESGLPKDSVVNVSQLLTLNKNALDPPVGCLSPATMFIVDQGVRLVLDL
jgi:mRNA interferase MazF